MQVIAINGKFPGAVLNATTNNNIVINVQNDLDESLLMTWYVLAKISYIYIIFIKTNFRFSCIHFLPFLG